MPTVTIWCSEPTFLSPFISSSFERESSPRQSFCYVYHTSQKYLVLYLVISPPFTIFAVQFKMNMRKVFLVLSLMLSLGMLCACSNDEDMNNLSKHTGVMCYNQHGEWYISYYHPGTHDSVDNFYPLNLSDEYKQEGINVVFLGKVIEMTDEEIQSRQIPLIGGHRYYLVYLEEIEIAE